jgi:anthraniloyl-CoA monooxygenase
MKIRVIGAGPAGLYFGILARKALPSSDITIVEKNAADVTWGWGVVFSDETLENFERADPESYREITQTFKRWDDIDVHFKGRTIRSGGHRFFGIRRTRLLNILQNRCTQLGVHLQFNQEIERVDGTEADLLVAADGINSKIRSQFSEHFRPNIANGKNRYIWLATTQVFDSFKFFIRENDHGLFVVHAYPFDQDLSTFIVETDDCTWRRAGLDHSSEKDSVSYCETLFQKELNGHPLISNNSTWISFRLVRNETWHHRNVVLIGDAAHTAHFSIGSGTKLAMEDAILLAESLQESRSVNDALTAYYDRRWLDVAKLQRAAEVSQTFFEDINRWKDFEPEPFAFKLLCRSKRVTHENLRVRDENYIASVDRWFADQHGCKSVDPVPPPMFTPFQLRGMKLHNRIVVSPMCQYSAVDGMPNDWHLVHLGSRAIGGASLVFAEMTDVSREGRISPGCAGLYLEEHVGAWKRIVDFIHGHTQARVGMQLGHAGRKGSTKLEWEGDNEPLDEGENWELMSASPIAWSDRNQQPREMDRADMDRVIGQFVRAAEMARQAGFDILELHMAHGYLLASFISPLTNLRTDQYGGPVENRMRFPLEVFDSVRKIWPQERPMSVRISAHDWVPGGMDPAQAVEVARFLKEHGCDVIDVSSGQTDPLAQPVYGRMYQAPFADRIRNELKIPTISVGNIQNWDHVNTLLVSGACDLCALARPHLYDPYFTFHAAADQNWDVTWPNQYLPAKPGRKKG